MNVMKRAFFALMAFVGMMLAAAGANAAALTVDTTDVVGTITGAVTTISAIGIAVLSLVVLTKLFKWIARVL